MNDEIKKLSAENEKLKHDLFYYKSIISKLPGSIFWKDSEGVYLGCNDFVRYMAGMCEVVGKTDYDMPWKKQADEIKLVDQNVMRTGEVVSAEEFPVLQSGKWAVFHSTKAPLKNEQGDIVGVIGISHDITDQKEAERLRVEKAEAEEREETMRLLAASMAHELRTPLRAISMGMTSVISKFPTLLETYKKAKAAELDIPYMYPADIESLEKVLGNIQLATREAFETVDMLVVKSGLSSIDTSNFQKCSIAECIETALHRYPLKESEKNLIHWEKDDFAFLGDYSLMVHIVFNLLKNALYFIAAAGKGDINIWLEKGDEFNKLHFKDGGRGIPEDILPRIFEPFFTTISHGTGVGLAFSELVMKSMGGKIECASEYGEFAKFVLSFPKCQGDK
jgi:PAS domain S-box-containing protein